MALQSFHHQMEAKTPCEKECSFRRVFLGENARLDAPSACESLYPDSQDGDEGLELTAKRF